jgi:hypothetical protein
MNQHIVQTSLLDCSDYQKASDAFLTLLLSDERFRNQTIIQIQKYDEAILNAEKRINLENDNVPTSQ